MKISLTHKAFKTSMLLFDYPTPDILGCVISDFFPKEGKTLIELGYLSDGPLTMSVPDRWSDELNEWREAEWDPETRRYRYFSLDACGGEWIYVPEEDVKTYHINLDWMARYIRNLVGIESEIQIRTIVPNLLWELGHIWVGHHKAPVFCTQNIAKTRMFDLVYDALLDLPGKSPGVVLSTAIPANRRIELPSGHRMLALENIVVETTSGCEMDMELVHGALKGTHAPKNVGPVSASVDYSVLTVHGREFIFPGEKQQKMIKILYRAWKIGNPRYRTKTALAEIESSGHALSHLFNRHPDWKEVIGYGGGFCWLNI